MAKKKKVNRFIAVWDMYGLESLHDVNKWKEDQEAWEKTKIWETLKNSDYVAGPAPRIPLNEILIRARVNSQRFYEIYEFESEVGFEDVRRSFIEHPQSMADTIRKIGYKIYSDRLDPSKTIIR